jgi:transcription elongation factor Elf1
MISVRDDEQGVQLFVCPMCHTPASVTLAAIDAGADWRCVRCGQRWDATRLAAVTAYAAWVADRPQGERDHLSTHVTAYRPGEVR